MDEKREEINDTMTKPDKAETEDIEYWKREGGIGDYSKLIYPNYPEFFDLCEKIRDIFPGKDITVEPLDRVRGPCINIPDVGHVLSLHEDDWVIVSKYCLEEYCIFDEEGLLDWFRQMV